MQLRVIGIQQLDGALMNSEKKLGETSCKIATLKKNVLNFAKNIQLLTAAPGLMARIFVSPIVVILLVAMEILITSVTYEKVF